MGCGGGKDKVCHPHTVLSGQTDEKGRYTVPQGKSKLELVDQRLREIPRYAGTNCIERLDVSQNELASLPKSMGSGGEWHRLADLNLSYNRFQRVPPPVASLRSLQTLRFNGNRILPITSDTFRVLPQIPQLRALHLCDCGLAAVPPEVAQCTALRELHLSQNRQPDLSVLPQVPVLDTVDLAGCWLGNIPPALARCPRLTSLDLSENHLPKLEQLITLRSVEALQLRRMNWGRPLPVAVWQPLAQLPNLRDLDLGFNALPSADGLERLPALTRLDLSCCNLRELPPGGVGGGIGAAPQLAELVLQGNQLSCLSGLATPCTRTSLHSLDVAGNLFAQVVRPDDAAWQEIGQLSALRSLVFQQWADKANSRNSNPYSTRLPWSLIAVPLTHVNGIALQRPFTTNPGSNLVTLLRDGYFKVDMGIEWEVRFSYHIKLLRMFSQHRAALTSDLRASVVRYKMFLFLQKRLSEEKLIAPLDVAFLHYVHMTYPIVYRRDCERIFGSIVGNFYHGVDRSNPSIRQHRRYISSVRAWEEAYCAPKAPAWRGFDYPCDRPADAGAWEGTLDGWPRCTAELAAAEFSVNFDQVSTEIFRHIDKITSFGEFLEEHALVALGRYMRFLAVAAKRFADARVPAQPPGDDPPPEPPTPVPPLAATPGIQVMLHVHQCMPHKLHDDLATLLGGRLADLNLRVDSQEDPLFEEAMAETKRLWQDTWGEDFLSEGLLDDSTPSFFSPTAQSHLRSLQRRVSGFGQGAARRDSTERLVQSNGSGSGQSFGPRRSSLKASSSGRIPVANNPSTGSKQQGVTFIHSAGV